LEISLWKVRAAAIVLLRIIIFFRVPGSEDSNLKWSIHETFRSEREIHRPGRQNRWLVVQELQSVCFTWEVLKAKMLPFTFSRSQRQLRFQLTNIAYLFQLMS
jgi:hypothetical protein